MTPSRCPEEHRPIPRPSRVPLPRRSARRGRAVITRSAPAPIRISPATSMPTKNRPSIRPTARAPAETKRAPQVHQQHRLSVPVPELHEPVMQVLLVGMADPLTSPRPANDRQHDVDGRDQQHEERDGQRPRGGGDVSAAGLGEVLADPLDRGDRQQHPEEHRAGVAHEDLRGMEVPGQEPDADARGDGGEQGGLRRGPELTRIEHDIGEEEGGRDRHHPRREPVQPVEQVDGVRDRHGPRDRHDHRQIPGQDEHAEISGNQR